jgi:hypothetical protein
VPTAKVGGLAVVEGAEVGKVVVMAGLDGKVVRFADSRGGLV